MKITWWIANSIPELNNYSSLVYLFCITFTHRYNTGQKINKQISLHNAHAYIFQFYWVNNVYQSARVKMEWMTMWGETKWMIL